MFLLQPPTITAPTQTGQMPTAQRPQQPSNPDDVINQFLSKPTQTTQQSTPTQTQTPGPVDQYLGTSPSHSSNGSQSTSETKIDIPKNNPLRKVVTFSTDVSATARTLRFANTYAPGTYGPAIRSVRNGTGLFTQCLNWIGTKVPALGHLTKWAPAVKFMGLAGRLMPYAGGILAAADVAVDYSNASGVKGAAGVIEESLASSGLDPKQIEEAMKIANKGIDKGLVEAELRKYLSSLNVSNINEITNKAKEGQKAKDAAYSSANTNATLTGGGAAIGAVIGGLCGVGVFSVPGAILGACIGAGVGNLVNFVGNKTGLFKAIGSFFS